MSKRLFSAFTLAEVLTTLMVIGIVAALTIPSLMNSYKKKSIYIKLNKAYFQLAQAVKMIPLEDGCAGRVLEEGTVNYD